MKKHFIRTRKLRWGGIAALLTLLVVTVSVLANAVFGTLAKRYGWYTLMTGTPKYEVSEHCFDILGEAFTAYEGSRAEIIFCDTSENLSEEVTSRYVYETATALSERYPDRLTVQCYDIWTDPTKVRAYTKMVDPATEETVDVMLKSTSVIIAAENYHRVYSLEEFFSFHEGDSSQVWAYNGERKLAAGLLRAISPETHIVCLTQNHGEVFYDYELLYLLDDAGYTVKYLDLYRDPIPEGCEMIISYNPNSDMIANDELSETSEADKLDAFLSVPGNSFWVLVENGTPALPNTEAYLEEWGIDFQYDSTGIYRYMVQDSTRSLTSDGYTIYADAGAQMQSMTRSTVFKNATAIRNASTFASNGDGSYSAGARTMYSLYEGGENAVSWANGTAQASADGAILMSLTEQKNEGGSSYVGTVASVDFFSEAFLQSAVYGNADAFMHTFSMMGRRHLPEGLTLKPFESSDISTVTTRQMLVWTLALSVTPAVLVTAVAVTVLVKRRNA